jgi:hypothetical protein
MEGNSATGAHIIPKYLQLKEDLLKKISQVPNTHSLYPMFHAMLERTERYLDKAMCCHTLIIATLMHPCYQMDLFDIAFGSKSNEVTQCLKLLTNEFKKVKRNQDK